VPAQTTSARLAATLAGVLALAVYALAAVPAIRNGIHGVSQFQDDAFYYIVTAQNYVRTGVFAFDGVNETNGFHPVWMAIVVGLLKACGPTCTPEHQVFAVKLVETLLRGVAVALCVGFHVADRPARHDLATGYLAIVVVLLCPAFVIFEQGMETTLATLLLILAIRAFVQDRTVALGWLLALLFLTRLDTAIFVAAPLLAFGMSGDRANAGRWAASALPLALAMIAYTGYNLVHTGHAVPISGALRSTFPVPHWNGGHLEEPLIIAGMYGWRQLVSANVVLCAAMLVAGGAALACAWPSRRTALGLLAVGSVGAALIANLLLFQSWEKSIDPRYLALPLTASAFFLAASATLAAERLGSWLRWPRLSPVPAAAVVALIALEGALHLERFADEYARTSDSTIDFFREIRAALPENAVIAGTDVGALAFWTGHRVVNLDGVINNYRYQDYLRDGRLRQYLHEQGVSHLALALWDRETTYTARPIEPMYRHAIDPAAVRGTGYDRHEFYVYSYLHHNYSDRIALTPSLEVFRKWVGKDADADIAYVVYRMPE
jgi:hypothetical protein